MQNITCKITGITPLLMHRPSEWNPRYTATPQEQAEAAAYRDGDGVLFLPALSVRAALANAADRLGGELGRDAKRRVESSVFISPMNLSLGIREFEVDARTVLVGRPKVRAIRFRPRIEKWEATFSVEYDRFTFDESILRRAMEEAGARVGVLDYRPQSGGPYGRFDVTAWETYD